MARKRTKTEADPNWRPNFRSVETLPDIKIVRTDFLLNSIAITVAVGLLTLVGFTELVAHRSMSNQLSELERKISENKADNDRFERLSAEFSRNERKVKEVVDFVSIPTDPVDLLFTLTNIMPREMVMTSLSFNFRLEGRKRTPYYEVNLSCNVSGNPAQATQIVDRFKTAIGEDEKLSPYIRSVGIENLQRDSNLGLFKATIIVNLNKESK